MKKVLLLSALVASVSSFAGTTGSVEAYLKNSSEFVKKDTAKESAKEGFKGTTFEAGVKTEVKVTDSGLSFGADVISKDDSTYFPLTVDLDRDYTNAWVKYEFPTFHDVNTYAKAKLNANARLTLEGDAKTTYNNVELGLNAKLAGSLAKEINPALVVKGSAKTDVSVIKDAKVELEVKNNFKPENYGFEYVKGTLSGKYVDYKDLEVEGKVVIKDQLSGKLAYYNNQKDDDDTFKWGNEKGNTLLDSYLVTAKYTGIKDTEITGKVYTDHLTSKFDDGRNHFVRSGLRGEVVYKGAYEGLTLTGKTHLGMSHWKNPKDTAFTGHNYVVELGGKAAYEYKVTDKFVVTPELGADYTAKFENGVTHDLTVTPGVKGEYKPVENLTLTGKVSTPVDFTNKDKKAFGYDKTSLKSELNVKYTW